jgi:prolipoprotein diacylglyceryltransferase
MYPNLFYLFKELLGIELEWLKVVNSFGFFVAISFLVGAWLMSKEALRKQALGVFGYTEEKIIEGKPASITDILVNFVIGFLFGYKLIGVLVSEGALADPQSFIFSSQGNAATGLLSGLFFAALKWWEKNKRKLAKPQERIIRIWPSDRIADITVIAAISGFVGAKIFDNLENWDRFIEDPIANLLSPSGLTYYGGLIMAIICLWYYFSRHKIRFIDMADVAAPALMLTYGLGRIGCQVSGDGDWGIINSAYIADATGRVVPPPDSTAVNTIIQSNAGYYSREFGSLESVPHNAVSSFAGLPDWLFAYTYPHNVNESGIPIMGCTWDDYCNYLPLPVFPTPLYEIMMALLLFGMLWSLRKKFTTPGRLFSLYLVVNGLERFLIEQIRVNTKYDFWGIQPTQAELIAVGMVLTGVFLWWRAPAMFGLKSSK